MNHSSLFSFEESSAWDPKIIRKRLVVSQDQLIKLNSIPGWAKIQANNNTLLLDKDFSIQSSQSECSIYMTQSNKRIENNTKLFNEQIENCKSTLAAYKVYRNKLTRSLSLFNIDKSYENLNNKTLKRTLSLQSVYQSSDASDINTKYNRCESSEKHSQLDFCNKTLLQRQFAQCKISHLEPQKNNQLLSRENSETMETISQLPLNIPTTIEKPIEENNAILPPQKAAEGIVDPSVKDVIESMDIDAVDLHPETGGKSNGELLAENVDTQSNNVPDQLKHVTESENADKSDSHSETTKGSNGVLPTVNATQCSNSVSNEPAKTVNGLNDDNSISSLKNLAESCVPVADESYESDISIVKEIPPSKVSKFASEKAASSLNVQKQEKFLSSHVSNANETSSLIVKETDTNDVLPDTPEKNVQENVSMTLVERNDDAKLHKLCPSKSTAINTSAQKLIIPDKELGTKNCNSEINVNESGSDIKMRSGENVKKEYDPAKYMKVKSGESNQKEHDPAKSADNNENSAKKRKLESRNKRSKRLRSEEKQGTLKIRSIKKVGEICYSVEEVETMLDIMKQFS